MKAFSSTHLLRIASAVTYFYLLPAAASTVAAGDGDSLIVKPDGSVWAFGLNASGQLGDGTTTEIIKPRQVMTGVQAVAAGNDFNLFLHRDGSAWAAGSNGSGQLGDATYQARSSPIPILQDVQAISARGNTSLLLKTDGTAWAAGASMSGWATLQAHPVMDGVQAIAAGDAFALFLKTDGAVMGLGESEYGQLGLPLGGYATQPVTVMMSGVKAIAAGSRHALFLKTDGTLWLLGQGNAGSAENEPAPPLQIASGVTAIAAGFDDTFFIKEDGSAWGAGPIASYMAGTPIAITAPAQLIAGGVTAIAAGHDHALFAMADGTFQAAGKHANGRLGDGSTDLVPKLAPVKGLSEIQSIAAAGNTSFFVDKTGLLSASGAISLQPLDGGSVLPRDTPSLRLTGIRSVAASPGFAQYLKTSGAVIASGYSEAGALGYAESTRTSATAPILASATQVDTGLNASFFLLPNGDLLASGGHYGNKSPVNPIATIPNLLTTDVKQVSAGDGHVLILKKDGTVWSAGDNSHGQTGQTGPASGSFAPAPIGRLNGLQLDIVALSAGSTHSLFLTASGDVWGLGSNLHGELTGDLSADVTIPKFIMHGIKTILAGPGNSFFIGTVPSGGYLYACGRNDFGQLGDQSRHDRRSAISIFARVGSVAAGDRHTLILQTNGIVWAVGDNSRGQTGTPMGERTPVPVGLPTEPVPTWEQENFGADAANPDIAGPDADPDHDGINNLLERAFHLPPLYSLTDPLDPAGDRGLPAVTAILQPDGANLLTLQYIREKASWGGSLTYAPQVSSSLGDGDWTAPAGPETVESIDARWERVTLRDTTGAGQPARFARVQVTSAGSAP